MNDGRDLRELFMEGGCLVSDGGRVIGGPRKFGLLAGGVFVSEDGTHFTDIDWVQLGDNRMTLTICSSSGSVTIVTGVPMSKEDRRAALPNGGKMPQSLSQLQDMFPLLYPDAGSQVYYDVLMEKPYVDTRMIGEESEGFQQWNDTILAKYHADIERRLDALGLEGRYPSYKVRDEMIDILVGENKRNMFKEWVESHEWDGVPRLRTWFQDTFGATAPALVEPYMEEVYLGAVSEAWFLGAIRRMYMETKHEVVPVLIGGQGIMKGTAIQYTAGNDEWYVECNEDVKQVQKFLESTRGRIVVELSEATQIRGPDVEALKAFISKSEDQLRKPYAHFEERYPRHFILIASTNIDNIFTDITGNRRFFPMYCDPDRATREFSVDRSVGQYDVEQVWAEALAMFRDGHKWYIQPNVVELAQAMQEFYTQENSNVTVIEDWLDDPCNGYTRVGEVIRKADIMQSVFGVGPGTLPTRDQETAYRAWTNATASWVKKSSTVRVGGKTSRVYVRIKEPGALKDKPKRLRVVDAPTESPEDIMRSIITDDGLVPGVPFIPRGLTPDALSYLEREGFIYRVNVNGTRLWAYAGGLVSDEDMAERINSP